MHERRRVPTLIVCEMRGVGILLGIGIRNGLIQRTSHGHMIGKIGGKPPVEVG